MQSEEMFEQVAEFVTATEEIAGLLKGEYIAIALDERIDDDHWPIYYIQDIKGTWLVAQRLRKLREEHIAESLQFIDLDKICAFKWVEPDSINVTQHDREYEEEVVFEASVDEDQASFEHVMELDDEFEDDER